MSRAEDRGPETDQTVAAGGAVVRTFSEQVREGTHQTVVALWRVTLLVGAACAGALTVEAIRAILR